MIIDIITPTNSLFTGEIKRVNLPGSNGSFEMLESHAPIIATLQKGKIVICDIQDKEHSFEIEGGVVEQSSNKVIVLVD